MTPSSPIDLAGAKQALEQGRVREALEFAQARLANSPDDPEALRLRATCLTAGNDLAASDAWNALMQRVPDDPEALYQLGTLAGDRGDFDAAVRWLRRAQAELPHHPQILNNLGLALEASGSLAEAESCFAQLASLQPAAAASIVPSLARVLFAQRKYPAALPYLDRVVTQYLPSDAGSWAARAVCLAHAGRDVDAEASYRRALDIDPGRAAFWLDYVRFLLARNRHEDAASALGRAHARLPDALPIIALLASCRLHVADWRDAQALRDRLVASIESTSPAASLSVPAYDFLALCDDPVLQRRAAEGWVSDAVPGNPPRVARTPSASNRVRLGFVSSDFRDHPVARLLVGLLEHLDRNRFELYAYATGRRGDDAFQSRIASSVDVGRSLSGEDAQSAARVIAGDAIDVLFDLNGFSGTEALAIFAQRCAPLQVNYLGYPGTLGSSMYDYVVADRYCVPPARSPGFVERILYVDPCYLPSDPTRGDSPVGVSRSDYGLPEDARVLAAFAATYKVLPEIFDAWCGLLREIPDAFLWLRSAPPPTARRLVDEAARRGIDRSRIVFAPADSLDRYLSRFPLADVLLDTMPYGAHTTVNDALFTGVPVVTLAGRSMASRASASQLSALGLDALVADSIADYQSKAKTLLLDADERSRIRAYLLESGRNSALFDMQRYANAFGRAIEATLVPRVPG